MHIQVTLDSGKWLRVDLMDAEIQVQNLYHVLFHPGQPEADQYDHATDYVRQYYPQYRFYSIVTDLSHPSQYFEMAGVPSRP